MECIANDKSVHFNGKPLILSRSGYTGEDGFEVSISDEDIENFMHRLLDVKDSGEQVA